MTTEGVNEDSAGAAAEDELTRYCNMRRGHVVLTSPTANRTLIDSVSTLGVLALMGGSVLLALNLFLIVALPFLGDVDWQLVGVSGFFALAGACVGLGGYGLMRVSSGWERKHGILTARDIVAAPEGLRTPLVAALTAADKIRASTAYRDQWLTNIDLDAALWDLARHVQIGTTLTAQLHGLAEIDEQHQYDNEAEAARASLAAVTDRVREAAQRLTDLALRVADLDAQLAEPARRAALEAQRTRSEAAAAQHAAQMTETRAALDRIDPALNSNLDTLTGQLEAYTELPGIAPPKHALTSAKEMP